MTWAPRPGKFRAKAYPRFLFAVVFILFIFIRDEAYGRQNPSESGASPTANFEQLSAQAGSSREAGHVDDAIRFYQGGLKLQPDWAEGWWYLGTLNYDADRYAEAIPAFQSLLALNPQMGPALAFLGLSEFGTRDYKNALIHLRRAQAQGYGDDVELEKVATYHLAILYNWNSEFEMTTALLRPQIQRSRPPDEMKIALGMALLRIPLLSGEVDPSKDALIRAAGEAASQLYRGNRTAALESLRQLLVDHLQTPYLHYAYASALADTGKDEEALGELVEESKLLPRSALPYERMASIQLRLRHPKQALAAARHAVLLAPSSAAAHELLARTLKSLGETQEAAKEAVSAKKLQAASIEMDLAQRQLYARSPTATTLQQAPAVAADSNFEALAQKAAAAQQTGQFDLAISYYQEALALRPQWEEGWSNLGTLYYAAARYADAIAALKRSAAINERSGNVWALLGLAEFETKDYQNSLIHLERGRDLGLAGNPAAVQVARYHLAILLNRNGDFDRATELLTPEIGAGPPEEQLKFALGMSLLRIPLLPEQLDPASGAIVRLAGETAALLSGSKYDQAFANFQQLLKMNSRIPYLHYAYGSALASASRYEEAEEQLMAETNITPGSALPFLRRSSIALQLHRAEQAAPLAQKAVQLAPESAEAHYLLGRSGLELGKSADSVKELETARDLAPNSPEVRFSLARAYAKAGQPDAADKERAAFERLNALVQDQRSRTASQAYGAIQNQNGIRAAETPDQTQTGSHPQ